MGTYAFNKDCRVAPSKKHDWSERSGLDKDGQLFKWQQCKWCGKKPTDRG